MHKKNRNSNNHAPAPHLEQFAKAVAEGCSHAEASQIAGRSAGSASYLFRQSGVRERISELRAIRAAATESAMREQGAMTIRPITFGANDIIMELWNIGKDGQSERAKVSALVALAEIFLLKAKNIEDLKQGFGWTDDENLEFVQTGEVPARIAFLTDCKTPEDLLQPASVRGEKKALDR